MSHGDRFFRILCILLLGYAVMGKGFAYLGVPPLYVGEMTMLYGIFALIVSPNWSRVLRTAWLWPLFALMAWGAIRTIPYLDTYGMDSVRDAAVYFWGIFAIVISSLLASKPSRLLFLENKFRKFAWWLLILAPIAFCTSFFRDHLPLIPGTDVPLILVKGGDLVVHLTGIFAFLVMLGGLEMSWVVPLMVLNLVLYFTGRAAMVTFGMGTAITTMLRPRSALPWTILAAGVIGVSVMWLLNIRILTVPTENPRYISAEQIVSNFKSIYSDSDDEGLAGSKEWRLLWWDTIINYTVHGPYFWKGKGFGVNLADDDGFQVEADHSLRSPHNGHLTMLARGGVPMLGLWALCQLTLAYGLISSAWSAHRSGRKHWFGLMVFLLVYWAAFLTNASFDVFLEGPVGGIWFWCVYGTALGAVWIYRNNPDALDEPRPPTAPREIKASPRRKKLYLAEALGTCAS